MIWANALIQGVLLGGFYALLATGLSLMFGVMRIINLAHGDLAVLGAFVAWVLVDNTSLHLSLVVPIVVVVMYGVGSLLQRGVLDRSLRSGVLVPLLATFGLAITIQNGLLVLFSPDFRSFGGEVPTLTTSSFEVTKGISLSALGLTTLGLAILILGGLQILLSRTAWGRSMRATAQDPEMASLVGINARSMYARATGIALAVAAIGGVFLGIRSVFSPSSGPPQLLFAFEAVAIGGFGSLWGTLVGGVVLGVAQTLAAQINPQYPLLAGHLLFLALLAFRGGGLLVPRGSET